MVTNGGTEEARDSTFKRVAEAAWAVQSKHERFLFKSPRPRNHPSRVAWVTANNLWQAQVQARKLGWGGGPLSRAAGNGGGLLNGLADGVSYVLREMCS